MPLSLLQERSLQPKYMVAHMSELDLPKSAVTRKIRGDIHFQCGRSLVEGGSLEEAVDEFSEVLKHCPDNAMVSELPESKCCFVQITQ